MKKFSTFKIIQLSLLVVLTLASLYFLMKPQVKQFVFSSTAATILFVVVWTVLLSSFIFLLIDFNLISTIKLNYHNLYDAAYSDQLSGIPNRFSCDTVIEKYYDKKLPENLACIMIDLANLPEVNSLYDHATGNILLKDFSTILSSASLSLCFVGRNGGNKFLAIFENGEQAKIDTFLARVADRVKQHKQYRFTYQYVKDPYLAQDVLQDVYILVLKKIHTLKNPRLFVSWLNQINFRICYNVCQKHLLHEQELQLAEKLNTDNLGSQHMKNPQKSPAQEVEERIQQAELMSQVLSLHPNESQAIIMKYYNDMSLDEIADAMNCSRSTVKRRLAKGRHELEKKLGNSKGGVFCD